MSETCLAVEEHEAVQRVDQLLLALASLLLFVDPLGLLQVTLIQRQVDNLRMIILCE